MSTASKRQQQTQTPADADADLADLIRAAMAAHEDQELTDEQVARAVLIFGGPTESPAGRRSKR